jgi:hypothetical protein
MPTSRAAISTMFSGCFAQSAFSRVTPLMLTRVIRPKSTSKSPLMANSRPSASLTALASGCFSALQPTKTEMTTTAVMARATSATTAASRMPTARTARRAMRCSAATRRAYRRVPAD